MHCNIFKYCGISNECCHLTAYICQFFIYFLNDSRVTFAKYPNIPNYSLIFLSTYLASVYIILPATVLKLQKKVLT